MQFFVSRISSRFSLRQVAKELGIHHALVYRASQGLIKEDFILRNGNEYVLNHKEKQSELAYFEYLRVKKFFSFKRNKTLELFSKEVIDKFPDDYFSFLLFGSTVDSLKPRDVDILLIVQRTKDIEYVEKFLLNVSRKYTLKFHILVVSFESVEKMFLNRDEKNVMNEVLNRHLIFYGSELFYRLLLKGRR